MEAWQGEWEFCNAFMRQDGRKGTTTVSASSEGSAISAIRDKASQDLFGTTSWQMYVQVRRLTKVTKQY